jgi:hypothetical protein
VVIERVVFEHFLVEDEADPALAVVRQRERRDAARRDAERPLERRGVGKGKARRAEPVGELLQVDPALFEHDREPQPGFPVFQKEALAMAARQAAPQGRGLGHREDRRMLVSAVRDAEPVEAGEQLFRRQRRSRHAPKMRRPAAPRKLCKRSLRPIS